DSTQGEGGDRRRSRRHGIRYRSERLEVRSQKSEVSIGGDMKGHRDLIAWQKAMTLVTDVYRPTQHFPKDELYGLTSQMRRAAISVPSNLAEGHGRNFAERISSLRWQRAWFTG